MRIENLQNENRRFIKSLDNFHVLEYIQDASVSPFNALNEYFMSKMNVRRRQIVIDIDKKHSAVIQAGAMQWMGGAVKATSGVKGIGDFFGKAIKGAVTKETAVKPEYVGEGCLVLEPTYKYIILQDVEKWGAAGMTIEDGMFLACDANVKQKVVTRKNVSSTVLGGEGFFNLGLQGHGVVALESNVPEEELIEIVLENDELKIDGNLAVCWSSDRSAFKTLRFPQKMGNDSAEQCRICRMFSGILNTKNPDGIRTDHQRERSKIPRFIRIFRLLERRLCPS